jgi:hypothetical protein
MHSPDADSMLPIMDNRTYSLTGRIESLDCHAFATFTRLAGEAGTPMRAVVLRPEPGGGWAYELRSEWSDPSDDAQNIAWTRAAIAEVIETSSCRAS